jgi:plasmid stability protein
MGNVLIRNLDDDVIARLKRRALEQGTSFEAVARGLLTEGSRQSRAEFLAWARANAAAQPAQTSDSAEFSGPGETGSRTTAHDRRCRRQCRGGVVRAGTRRRPALSPAGNHRASAGTRPYAAGSGERPQPQGAQGELLPGQVPDMLARLRGLPMALVPFGSLLDAALGLSLQVGHSVQDCLYLALARQEAVRLATFDRRLADLATTLAIPLWSPEAP